MTDETILRTVVMPSPTIEQIEYLDRKIAAVREVTRGRRVGGVFTGPWPRFT